MKIPCELVVRYVLPYVRREMIRELADTYGLTQAEIARRFEVSGAAISMYMRSKKGAFELIESSSDHREFRAAMKESVRKIADGGEVNHEVCSLCSVIRRSGAFVRVCESHMMDVVPLCNCRICSLLEM